MDINRQYKYPRIFTGHLYLKPEKSDSPAQAFFAAAMPRISRKPWTCDMNQSKFLSAAPCSIALTVGDTGDVDGIGTIVASEIKTEGVEQVGSVAFAFGLVDVDLYVGSECDI